MKHRMLFSIGSLGLAGGSLLALVQASLEIEMQGYLRQGMYRLSAIVLQNALNRWALPFLVLAAASSITFAAAWHLAPARLRSRAGTKFLLIAISPAIFWFGFEALARFGWLAEFRWPVRSVATAMALAVAISIGWLCAEATEAGPPQRRRLSAKVGLVCAIAWLGLNLAVVSGERLLQPSGPNVVVVYFDTLRADHLGIYGYGRPTSPNIDELARSGVVFENVVSQASATYPSVPSALTSTVASSFFDSKTCVLRKPDLSIVEVLRDAGYRTAGFASSLLISRGRGSKSLGGFEQGFELFDDSLVDGKEWSWRWRSPEGVVEHAVRWLDRKPKGKFFLFLYVMDPHDPYHSPEPYNGRFADPDYRGDPAVIDGEPTPSEIMLLAGRESGLQPRDVEHLAALYDGEIAYGDSQLGRLIGRMNELGLMDDTLFVILSDHGEEFMDHGGVKHGFTLYQETVQVPLILRSPKQIPIGHRVDTLVRSLDVAPTILELAGVPVPRSFQGRSLRPLLDGSASTWDERAITETPYADAKALVTRKWKYIHHFDIDKAHPNLSPRYSTGTELYDLESDPAETVNLAKRFPDVVKTLHAEMIGLLPEKEVARLQAAKPFELDENAREGLRALGYIQ